MPTRELASGGAVPAARTSPKRSQHRAKHCCSLLLSVDDGFVTHFAKHLSRTVCIASATRCQRLASDAMPTDNYLSVADAALSNKLA